MEETIQKIVEEAFSKAKENCPKDSKSALSKHIADFIGPSPKTVTRTYERHIEKTRTKDKTSADTINEFCIYLGYDSYQDYKEKNTTDHKRTKKANHKNNSEPATEMVDATSAERKAVFSRKNIRIYIGLLALIIGFFTLLVYLETEQAITTTEAQCMTWAEDHYEKVSCDTQPYSAYGTEVIPLNKQKLKNFKKVEVTRATQFFSRVNGRPLIWYYKVDEKNLEYYTAPGLQPVNGETLKKITEHMIEKYVPVHVYREESFVK